MQTLLKTLAERVLGSPVVEQNKKKYDLSRSFERLTLLDSIVKYLGVKKDQLEERKELEEIAKKLGVENIKEAFGW